jgi:hypothetical protein
VSANPEAEGLEPTNIAVELAHVPGGRDERRLPRSREARDPSTPYEGAAVVLLLVAETAWCAFLLTLAYRLFS